MTARPRCSQHQDRDTLPALCATCQRIRVERQIVERTVDVLLGKGYALNVDNGGDDLELPQQHTRDRAAILGAMMETDDEHLIVFREDDGALRRWSWIWFVYGNGGWDVISDYGMNVDADLAEVHAFAESFEVAR